MRTALIAWLGLTTMLALPPPAGASDWLQFNFNREHTGNNQQETTIQGCNVSTLHVRYQVPLPSIADGAPAFLQGISTSQGVKDVLFLNTKDGHILALDAATGATIWSRHPTGPNYTTSSPAVDPSRQFVYAYALDGRVHKYMVGDGSEITTGGWPQLATLKPQVEKGSSALSLVNTVGLTNFLYVANGGYPGDAGDYQGHVTAINLSTGTQSVFNTDCSNLACHLELNGSGVDCGQLHPDCPHVQSAVWATAGVVYSADLDRIFFVTGNGDYDADKGGHDWGDSVLALQPDGTGSGGGSPLDSYTPSEFQTLQNTDADLGSTSPAILPTVPGSNIAHLGVQSQKDPGSGAKIRLLNLSNLSGSGAPGHVGGELQKINVPQGGEVLTAPAVWVNPSDGSVWVFYANGNGITGLKVVVDGMGNPSIASQWTNGAGGTSPIIANGILYYAGPSGMAALDPTSGNLLWSDGSIGGIHWESPIVVNGRLYITDESARLWAFEPDPGNVTLSIDDPGILEGNAGVTLLGFTVSLSCASSTTATVSYATADGTAKAGIDYAAKTSTVTLAPGQTSRTILVPVLGNATVEPNKTLVVNLTGPTGATIAKSQGTGTILNDDPPAAAATIIQYRLYSPVTLEHLYTTDSNEYTVLGTRGWNQEGAAYTMFKSGGYYNGNTNFAVPLYRLYHPGVRQHHWTTDANEVTVLAEGAWTYEGIPGYVLPTPVSGTTPLYRLMLASPPLHLWTTDAHEYAVLTTPQRGWVGEGIAGYVLP